MPDLLRYPGRGFRSGSKARGHKSAGVLTHARPDMGKAAQGAGLCEFGGDFGASFAQRVSPLCAGGQARTSMSGWRKGENEPPRARRRRMKGGNKGLRQGAMVHSETWLRGGSWNCSSRRRYARAVASRMRRTRVRWLATKSPCRTVTWQEASPCTGMRLRPKRSRRLLRLSAELRRL